ncbi:hypothetical protein PCANC_08926 [Puccinia coronata f. sp. avenae]|uniref:Uncharacterized protein n=1 Tax=Puccinia coronata f. sp. avenae TaxID=200324 RepID=A0A2N5T2G5_9BASI|nr:hypothetical protein PCANC_08926 [Puccinia coronata f. sp. avenae]
MDIRFGDWILVGLQGKRGNTLWVDVYISPTSKSFWSSSPSRVIRESKPLNPKSKLSSTTLVQQLLTQAPFIPKMTPCSSNCSCGACAVLLQRLCFSQQEMNGGREPKALMISLMILEQRCSVGLLAHSVGTDGQHLR